MDINTEHSFPARKASNKPNGIVCKLTRRLERDKVVAARKQVAMVQLGHLGFLEDISLKTYLAIYCPLSPRLQSLLCDANKFKVKNAFHFCWSKNGFVFLRKSETSQVIR